MLPPGADTDGMTAECANGILTIKLWINGERPEAMKKVQVSAAGK